MDQIKVTSRVALSFQCATYHGARYVLTFYDILLNLPLLN